MLKKDLSIQGSLIPGGESRYTYILHVLFWGMVPFVISLITFSILDHGHPGGEYNSLTFCFLSKYFRQIGTGDSLSWIPKKYEKKWNNMFSKGWIGKDIIILTGMKFEMPITYLSKDDLVKDSWRGFSTRICPSRQFLPRILYHQQIEPEYRQIT